MFASGSIKTAIGAIALIAAAPAMAEPITLDADSIGDSFTINFDGFSDGVTHGDLGGAATFTLTGADVIAALENGVSQVEEVKGRFAQVAGLRYAYTLDAAPNEGRIIRVEVMKDGEWTPIDEDAMYGVVSNNFLRGGGDGYAIFRDKAEDAYDFGPSVEDVVAEYLTAGGEYAPKVEGRITVE